MFEKLYDYSNSEKFVVSSEIFKSLFVTNCDKIVFDNKQENRRGNN